MPSTRRLTVPKCGTSRKLPAGVLKNQSGRGKRPLDAPCCPRPADTRHTAPRALKRVKEWAKFGLGERDTGGILAAKYDNILRGFSLLGTTGRSRHANQQNQAVQLARDSVNGTTTNAERAVVAAAAARQPPPLRPWTAAATAAAEHCRRASVLQNKSKVSEAVCSGPARRPD